MPATENKLDVPYVVNARLTAAQREHLAAIADRLGRGGASAAVRELVERDMERCGGDGMCTNPRCPRHGLGGTIERQDPMFHAGDVEVLSARAEPDLGHVEIKIMRPAPDQPGASDVTLLHLSAEPALEFLEQLATAVQTLDQTAGEDA